MASDQDFYAVLGAAPEDDVTLIKRRYRQLVRENHPDIAADRDAAHETMLAINAAWTILSDPAERARYDRSRGLSLTPKPRSPADDYIAGKTRATTTPRPAAAPPDPAARRSPRPSRGPARGTARGSGQTRTRLLTMVFEAAELYFFQGRAEDAIAICQTVMKADPGNAEAPALLGDIYAEQGRRDVAQQMYQIAVRNQPQNALYVQKLEALGGVAPAVSSASMPRPPSSPRAATTRSTTSRHSSSSRTARGSSSSPSSRAAPQSANAMRGGKTRTSLAQKNLIRSRAGFALLILATLFIVWGCVAPGEDVLPLSWLPGSEVVPGNLVWTSAIAALLGGIALPLLDLVPRCAALRQGEPRWLGVPLLVAMLTASTTCFPFAILVWLVASLVRGGAIKAWLVILIMSLVIASTISLGLKDDHLIPRVLADAGLWWSGRTILPLLVMGWALGSQAARK